MKKTILSTLIAVIFISFGCEPTSEDRDLGALMSVEELDYSIIQNPEQDYLVNLENNTEGIQISWDYGFDITRDQKTTIRFNRPGEYTIKVMAVTKNGLLVDEQNITVTKQDPELFKEQYDILTGNGQGKTWTWNWNRQFPFGEAGFQVHGLNTPKVPPLWWKVNLGGLNNNGVLNDEITFNDIDGVRTMTLKSEKYPIAGETTGNFKLEMEERLNVNQTDNPWSVGVLYAENVVVPFGFYAKQDGAFEFGTPFYKYHILKITEDELVLSATPFEEMPWVSAFYYFLSPKK